MAQLKRKLDIETSPGVPATHSFSQSQHVSNGKRINSQVPIYAKHLVQPYRRIKKIGQGKHSICYEIIHPNGDTYAMKTLPIRDHKFKSNHMSRIINEIEIHKLLSTHNNIATFIEEFQVQHEYVAIVMNYYPNNSIETHFSNGIQLREWEVRKLMTQLLGGVFWIHENDIVHGDLKLGNLLLDEHFNLKICDFGHSFNNCNNEIYTRNFINSTTFISNHNKIIGTPNYLAPEIIERIIKQNTNDNLISFEVDVWAIGVILYVLVVGALPFLDDTLDMMCDKIMNCSIDFPETNRNNFNISNDVVFLIRNILKRNPLERLTIPEIIANKWFQSYFPESFNIYDNLSLDSYENSSMNLQSTLNFKKCLTDSGFSKLMKPIHDNDDNDNNNDNSNNGYDYNERRSTKIDIFKSELTSPRKGSNSLTESFINNNKSVDFRKIRLFLTYLEEHSNAAKLERIQKIKQYQPPTVVFSNPVELETPKNILISHYQLTLERILESEQILLSSGQLCPDNQSNGTQTTFTYVTTKNIDISGANQGLFVYQLSNGDIGTLFPNGHTLLKLSDSNAIWYLVPDHEYGWISKCFDCNNLSIELQEKLNDANIASNLLNTNNNGMNMNGLLTKEPGVEDVFVRNVTTYENNQITMIELSDGSIQFDFDDGDEFSIPLTLSIRNYGESITLLSKVEGIKTLKILDFIQRFECDKSSSHIRDKLIVIKKCLKERNMSLITSLR
ncbi:similar to Saccharomyces cerevisiae YMR001C CDC5 Polo-like kinase with multiple functions in mitosis and cytokinesis through substrate phosphorylation [Maudiozyma saulgeensis]|uniref:Similar to Saccharomyces cerevisiae YMR001C CDC5 Polo-like kinase with multiple functions in mitosis and cytokinesis through substrate phosphorylation n=1 Tax=Maudiozyma saulgeensis TaxID=1789683 RepID=A0A1X7R0B4_9SACH|nr:similar to Saccharomyces cerevisiae YMR001C CDC5 Polo-like kinase with multiple functions in mitosis and cytokinesis through substrate phosphorylation [Kazachstania saulgeensis]